MHVSASGNQACIICFYDTNSAYQTFSLLRHVVPEYNMFVKKNTMIVCLKNKTKTKINKKIDVYLHCYSNYNGGSSNSWFFLT